MKICVISFDYWKFDHHIKDELKRQGVEASHIDISTFKYKYASKADKIANAVKKLLFNKNIKLQKRQEYVVQQLEKLPKQDIILIIRPDLLDENTHISIKKHTDAYYAYLYDSTKRFSISHLSPKLFDRIYSFDPEDVKKYGYIHIPNYIYLPKKPLKAAGFEYEAFIVMSKDERLPVLNKIAAELDRIKIKYKLILFTRSQVRKAYTGIECSQKEICIDTLLSYLDKSRVFIDIVRFGHHGLSFRVFESLAYQRKLITSNASVLQYDFYNPQNIMVIGTENVSIDPNFFKTPYVPLPNDIYQKYTIENWVNTVFFNQVTT